MKKSFILTAIVVLTFSIIAMGGGPVEVVVRPEKGTERSYRLQPSKEDFPISKFAKGLKTYSNVKSVENSGNKVIVNTSRRSLSGGVIRSTAKQFDRNIKLIQ